MMNSRGLYVLLYVGAAWLGIYLGLTHPARPAELVTCKAVLNAVASEGPKQAEKNARAAGATDAQIEAARKCLKDFKERPKPNH